MSYVTKHDSIILITIFVGVLILFIFPEPEENFLAYFGTFMFFVILTLILIKTRKKNRN